MTSKKVIRAQNIAIENKIPTIYLVDSAGVFLPLQRRRLPRHDDFGASFAIMRSCRRWAFRKSPPSWACVWLVADIFRDVRSRAHEPTAAVFFSRTRARQAAIGAKSFR